MVGHDDVFMQFDIGKPIFQIQPFPLNHFPCIIQYHTRCWAVGIAVGIHSDNLAEQTFPILHANGDEIQTRLRIIVPLQADGFPVECLPFRWHTPVLLRPKLAFWQ
jgi:hypothetical protein